VPSPLQQNRVSNNPQLAQLLVGLHVSRLLCRRDTDNSPQKPSNPPASQPHLLNPNTASPRPHPLSPHCPLRTPLDSNNRAKLEEQARNIARGADRKGLEAQQIRRWNVGDVYAPHDLSGAEQSKWKRLKQKARPRWDVLDQLNIKPMDHYKVWFEISVP
jgi:hypothetical protein